ncbi:recombinase family protein [Halomarina salina]|uniref:Recombinase family protein n=1 Tax=Halomarina salina TaxID=1872699 RepID=A0ABD5RPQ3_9EURY|nr:recombinase family protein [Halomarina salina]
MHIRRYHRVSTENQSLERQRQSTADYCRRIWDINLAKMPDEHIDRSTGTNTDRSGYQAMMDDVEDGEVDAVVVHSVSRIARSIRDLDRTAERIVDDAGAELHIISEGFVLRVDDDDPYQRAMFQLLGVFAELEASIAQQRTREGIAARQASEEYQHGQAPLGFVKDDGRLIEAENYPHIRAVINRVHQGEQSKRSAARELDSSRSTVRRCIEDRPELYDLPIE